MSIVLALIVFSVLVIIHEFGHFLLAKKNGIGVTEFSVGMGPRLFSFVKGETRYSWKLLPFGGSCMMIGEDEEATTDNSFGAKSVWARISVVAAGPIFNFVLAWILAMIVIGYVGPDKPYITAVEENSPASEAGLMLNDTITAYNGVNVSLAREIAFEEYINPIGEKPISIEYKRDGKKYKTKIIPKKAYRYALGITYTANDDACQVEVMADGALEKAGVTGKIEIVRCQDVKITSGNALSEYFKENPLGKETISITYKKEGKEETIQVEPIENEYYTTGMQYNMYREKTGALETIHYSFLEVKYVIKNTLKSLGLLVRGKVSKDDVAGPVGIVDIIGDTYQEARNDGWLYVFLNLANLTILLSANLGVMNLLPLPALDGGRLVFLIWELVTRHPVSKEKEGMVHFVGMILLMLLMVFILFNDLSRIF